MFNRRLALGLIFLAGVGTAAWFLYSSSPPKSDLPGEDTGMSAERAEELMRSIGYVQQ